MEPKITLDLRGKCVLVTGASRGIGRETAIRMGLAGARVAVEGVPLERGGVVDEDVDAADLVDHRLDLARIAEVGADGDGVADLLGYRTRLGLAAVVVDGDARAGEAHADGRLPPDAARRAGDQSDTSAEVERGLRLHGA
jgi:NAD(P)-dependent dehydrogenase (short-subunit alcohol dehydrogenase family)